MKSLLYGRELLLTELSQKLIERMDKKDLDLKSRSAYYQIKGKIFCQRCQMEMIPVKENECICQKNCAYCRNCIKMGKVRKCSLLYSLSEPNNFNISKERLLYWSGRLSVQQKEAAKDLINSIQKKEVFLLWAVAGAGKTEILFPGINYALQRGERVCIASPRVDVCLELAPRIKEAFPTVPLSLLYADKEENYSYRQLTIATTHQLFRFHEAFDLLIIDEIDAFPFENDKSLQSAAKKARKKISSLIYLSATPNRQMQKEVKIGKLTASILPARYHGYPLPVPVSKWCVNWQKNLFTQFQRTSFGKIMAQKIKEKRRFLIFIANIKWMLSFEEYLRKIYPKIKFESVSAKDSFRKDKVLLMRKKKIQFLMTTTILERGVTFPNIDVFVLGADKEVYTESALVQIAGRCGRSADYPEGEVFFFHNGKTLAIKRSIKQIKKMNILAEERGLLK